MLNRREVEVTVTLKLDPALLPLVGRALTLLESDWKDVNRQLAAIRDHLKAIGQDPSNPTPPAPPAAARPQQSKGAPQVKRQP